MGGKSPVGRTKRPMLEKNSKNLKMARPRVGGGGIDQLSSFVYAREKILGGGGRSGQKTTKEEEEKREKTYGHSTLSNGEKRWVPHNIKRE